MGFANIRRLRCKLDNVAAPHSGQLPSPESPYRLYSHAVSYESIFATDRAAAAATNGLPAIKKDDSELNRCPLCNYSLRGLPDRHACPECGFSYDKQMIVERPNVKTHLLGAAAYTVLFLGQSGWMASRGGLASVPAITYVTLAFYPLFAWYLWRRRHSG